MNKDERRKPEKRKADSKVTRESINDDDADETIDTTHEDYIPAAAASTSTSSSSTGFDDSARRSLQASTAFFSSMRNIYITNPILAKNYFDTFFASVQAIVSETTFVSDKTSKPHISFLQTPKQSTDAIYDSNKPHGLRVFQEIKNITTERNDRVDLEIMGAESQHKSRLVKEDPAHPSWHKTTVNVGNDNPWPFTTMAELNKNKGNVALVLRTASERIEELVNGRRAPREKSKKKKDEDTGYAPAIFDKLKQAEHLQSPAGTSAVTKNLSQGDTLNQLNRKLLVTESINVNNPNLGFVIKLNRLPGGRFQAHSKRDKDPSNPILYPRTHWDQAVGSRTLSRPNAEGNTALHGAAKTGQLWIVKGVVDQGVDKPNNFGQTPLHVAVQEGKVDVVTFLLSKNASVVKEDNNHNTPLDLACANGNLHMVKLLCEKIAPLNRDVITNATTKLLSGPSKDSVSPDLVSYLRTQSGPESSLKS